MGPPPNVLKLPHTIEARKLEYENPTTSMFKLCGIYCVSIVHIPTFWSLLWMSGQSPADAAHAGLGSLEVAGTPWTEPICRPRPHGAPKATEAPVSSGTLAAQLPPYSVPVGCQEYERCIGPRNSSLLYW